MDKIREDAVGRDCFPLEIGRAIIDREAGGRDGNHERESQGESLEEKPNPVFRIHVHIVYPHRVIFRDEVVVDGIREGLRIDADLPLVEVEGGYP